MVKYRMPTINQLIENKIIYGPRREPVWVYIEKQMRVNISRKPYNEKVGKWLKFLKDLKYHYYCESKKQLRILLREVGPSWYMELAAFQIEILEDLPSNIKKDLFGDFPARTRKSLSDLGVTYYIPNKVLLNAMATCVEDPGIFIWNLYSALYKQSPSEVRGEYDRSAMILMSALVAIDLKECIECLEKLTAVTKKPIAIRVTSQRKTLQGHEVRSANMKLMSLKRKMLLLTAKCTHRGPFKHVQSSVGSVSYVGARPRYVLNSICYLPTGYIPIHGGTVWLSKTGEMVGLLTGYWTKERATTDICDSNCDCEEEWENAVMNYVREQKCMCKHLYDYGLSGKPPPKYFYPPGRHRQYYFDKVRIYQDNPMEDFISHAVEEALLSGEPTPTPSLPSVKAAGLTEGELLESFLGDLAYTPLIIPHLPQASKLNNLLEWVRRRVKGRVNPELQKQLLARSMRRWLWLKHVDFKMRAYRIPFTKKQMQYMSWRYKPLLGKVFNVLLNNFVIRNSLKQLEQTRLWWPSMMFDMYSAPSAFRDIYFSYMPAKMTDTHIVNPFNSEQTLKFGAKTCPLNIFLPPTQS